MNRLNASKHPLLASLLISLSLLGGLAGLNESAIAQSISSKTSLTKQSKPSPIEPLTVEGRLDHTSDTLDDGSYYDIHTFEGTAGQSIIIELNSEAFDPYLILFSPSDEELAWNDDSLEGLNSRIVVTLPETGRYTIVANAFAEGEIGPYVLNLQEATQSDFTLAEANRLFQAAEELDYQNQFQEQLDVLQQALTLFRQADIRIGEGITLYKIATVYLIELGQYSAALDYLQEAIAIYREVGDRDNEGIALHAMGLLHEGTDQYSKALDYYQQALAVHREVGNREGEELTLNNIGLVYSNIWQPATALDYYEQALTIRRETGDRAAEGDSFNNIGRAYRELGQHTEALEAFQQALAIHREAGGVGGQDESTILNNIGLIYHELGQHAAALDYYQQAVALNHEQAQRGDLNSRDIEGGNLNNIGALYQEMGEYSTALDYAQQALTIAREMDNRSDQVRALLSMGTTFYQTHQYAAAEDMFLQAMAVATPPRERELRDADKVALFEAQSNLSRFLQQTLIAQNSPEKTLAALAVSEQGRARALVDILATRQADPNLTRAPDIATIQHIAQQQNATLVQYSVIDNMLGSVLYIWVIKPNGEITFRSVDLATLGQSLDELVSMSRTEIGVRRNSRRIAIVPTLAAQQQQLIEQQHTLQQLYQLLIQPIQDLLPAHEDELVVFIPQSELFLVPFPALMNGEGRYLIQDHTILTAPSIQVLQLAHQIRQSRSREAITAENVLIVGNPTMPEVWNPNTQTVEPLMNLPGAAAEADAIAQLFNTQPLLLEEASETVVLEQMQGAQLIHFATHGLLEYGNPQESGLLDSPGAIALAADSYNNGLLTSSEIFNLDLEAELVVLSACDTGRGTIMGDGVIGLSRSLISAGVPSVLVSLWAVDDAATSELMQDFYRRWRSAEQPIGKAQALRQAMLTTMQKYPEPRLWAAFTLIGESQ